jgi:hypothetical protein
MFEWSEVGWDGDILRLDQFSERSVAVLRVPRQCDDGKGNGGLLPESQQGDLDVRMVCLTRGRKELWWGVQCLIDAPNKKEPLPPK